MIVTCIGYNDFQCFFPLAAANVSVGSSKIEVYDNNIIGKVDENHIGTVGQLEDAFIRAIDSGHYSLLEHIYFTFYIEGISRACSHQLVRHRLASYTQESQRYCRVNTDNDDWYVIPPSIMSDSETLIEYQEMMRNIAEQYNHWVNMGVKKEDARFILPNACKTNIMMSMNGRAFVEQAEKRLCHRAQWEIQELYTKMKQSIIHKYENYVTYRKIYELAKPKCCKTGCTEANPCGKPYVEKFYE